MYRQLLASTALVSAGMLATNANTNRKDIGDVLMPDHSDQANEGVGEMLQVNDGGETEASFLSTKPRPGDPIVVNLANYTGGGDFFPEHVLEASKRCGRQQIATPPTVH